MTKRLTIIITGLLWVFSSAHTQSAEVTDYLAKDSVQLDIADAPFSKCAGNPINPQCAFDTWVSCNQKQDANHCKTIGLEGRTFLRTVKERQKLLLENHVVGFRIARKTTLLEDDFISAPDLRKWFSPGDVEIAFTSTDCEQQDDQYVCNWKLETPVSLFIRKHGTHWKVSGWTHDTGDVFCEGAPLPGKNPCDYWIEDTVFSNYLAAIDPDRKGGWRTYTPVGTAP